MLYAYIICLIKEWIFSKNFVIIANNGWVQGFAVLFQASAILWKYLKILKYLLNIVVQFGLTQLVATLVLSTKLLYSGPG